MLCVLAYGWGGGGGGGRMSVYLYFPDYILNNFIILNKFFLSVLLLKVRQTS